ncbi:hypothetical protein BDZ89DRAFT_1041850 [Hymenopellis radicata]|nr:hypothetical protein BDZ89DRAFT_1041850 [Hymenopellis radicata]
MSDRTCDAAPPLVTLRQADAAPPLVTLCAMPDGLTDLFSGILRSHKAYSPYTIPSLEHDDAGHYVVGISIQELANCAAAQPLDDSDSEETGDAEEPVSAKASVPLRRSPRNDASVPSPDQPATAPNASRKAKARRRYKQKRRDARKLEQELLGSSVKRCTAAAYAAAQVLSTHYTITGHGYQGQRDAGDRREYTLQELLDLMHFRLIEWDGYDPVKILDSERRLLIFLAGRPKERWDEVEKELWEAYKAAYEEIMSRPNAVVEAHRCGDYVAVGSGISLGNGSVAPGNLRLKWWESRIVEKLRGLPALHRLSGFVNRAFEGALPKMHAHYAQVLHRIIARNPRLRRNFENTVLGGAHFNLGPIVATRRHRDHLNFIPGPCPTTPCGLFDHKRGGHLVLWEVGLVRRADRGSFTQYMAAGLVRWVENGFKLNSTIELTGSAVERVGVIRRRETALARAIKLLPVIDVD